MIDEIKEPQKVAGLFEEWEETLIWSCLQGVMGKIYGNNRHHPGTAMAILGDFAFLAGEPDEELAMYKPKGCTQDFMIMIPQHEGWQEMIESCYEKRAKKVSRYAFKKEADIFDREKLKNAKNALPEDCVIQRIDKKLYWQCRNEEWSRDLVSQYEDYDKYCQLGIGVVILKNQEIVSGASSYSRYKGGIEIEIDTRADCRRKGLAYICGAELILECMKCNLYPSWDAQNLWSSALARKLGYRYSHTYTAYEIWGY